MNVYDFFQISEADVQSCPVKIDVLKNFAKLPGKHLCHRLLFNEVVKIENRRIRSIKIENLAQVFFCESCEISKNAFF